MRKFIFVLKVIIINYKKPCNNASQYAIICNANVNYFLLPLTFTTKELYLQQVSWGHLFKLDCMLPHLRAIIVQNWRSNCCTCARIFLLSHCVKVFTEKLLQSSIEIRDTFSITYFTTTSTYIVPCAGLVSAFKLTMCSLLLENGIFFLLNSSKWKWTLKTNFFIVCGTLHCLDVYFTIKSFPF